MNIVSSTFFLRKLRNLDFFQLDLGKSKKIVGKDEFRKVDEFILKYKNVYEKDINIFGKIGDRIVFYEDLTLEPYNYIIFKDSDIYEVTYNENDLLDIKNYILETLRKVDDFESTQKEKNDRNDQISKEKLNEHEYWIAKDDKNNGKKYLIDQTLSKEEYRKKVQELFQDIKTNE